MMQRQEKFNTRSPMIFNEEEYGRYLDENAQSEFLRPKIYTIKELTVLAKYYRIVLKLPEEEVKTKLIQFCNINYIGFDLDIKYREINKVMEEAYKTELRSCNGVPITKNEWEKIKLIEDEKARKILFVMLAVAKFNRLNPIIYEEEEDIVYTDMRLRCYLKTKDILRLAKTTYRNKEDFYLNYEEYVGKGLLDLLPSNRPKHILNFGDIEYKEEETLITITDMDNLIEVYKKLNKEANMKQCQNCGRWFEDKSESGQLRLCSGCRKQKNASDKREESKAIKKYQSRKDQSAESEIKLYTCIDCGAVIGRNKKNHKSVRCKKCQKEFEYKSKLKGNKLLTCKKCGKQVIVSSKSKRELCDDCYREYKKEYDRERKKK